MIAAEDDVTGLLRCVVLLDQNSKTVYPGCWKSCNTHSDNYQACLDQPCLVLKVPCNNVSVSKISKKGNQPERQRQEISSDAGPGKKWPAVTGVVGMLITYSQ